MDAPRATSDAEAKLIQIRRAAEERDAKTRAEKMHIPYADIRTTPVSIEALKLIPEAEAREKQVAGIQLRVRALALAALHPTTPEVQALAKQFEAKKYTVKIFTASRAGLEEAWAFYKFVPLPKKVITGTMMVDPSALGSDKGNAFKVLQDELAHTAFEKVDTTHLFEVILSGALAARSSDVHLEAHKVGASIRFRVDGLLHEVFGGIPLKNYSALIARIKLLSGMKLNVRSEPQDGRFAIGVVGGSEIEVRVSVIPSEFGEVVVMRLLDPTALAVELANLGMRPDDQKLIETELSKPNGLILNTGPTGSGKTTTLYSFLNYIVRPEIKVITIEDPIEYRLTAIEQTQVDAEGGYTFANGLRSILRQDPDVILVGEIRDGETADIAMQAALTGHLVFSTLHTNNALGAVPRLVDLGVRAATIGPAINVIIAQRLVRRLCDTCRVPRPFSPDEIQNLKSLLSKLPQRVNRAPYEEALEKQATTYTATGCTVCSGFGYKGRVAIFEFLRADSELSETILRSPSEVALKQCADHQGMVTMQQDGILKVLAGTTTFDEVESVTGPLAW
jgi:type II secretory ATPase GspE/PulE/Tfp pilus assembly ATPase PilB-like protein